MFENIMATSVNNLEGWSNLKTQTLIQKFELKRGRFSIRFWRVFWANFCFLKKPWTLRVLWQPLWTTSKVRAASKRKHSFKNAADWQFLPVTTADIHSLTKTMYLHQKFKCWQLLAGSSWILTLIHHFLNV